MASHTCASKLWSEPHLSFLSHGMVAKEHCARRQGAVPRWLRQRMSRTHRPSLETWPLGLQEGCLEVSEAPLGPLSTVEMADT
jgi:hypothetical protein